MRDEISLMIPGRPGRPGVKVHFRAIRRRCHRRIVSGVTMVATCRKTRRPSPRPLAARRRRWSSVSRRRRPFSLQDAVLLYQVLDNVLLVVINPSREGQEQYLQRRESGLHWSILPGLGNEQEPGRVFGHYERTNAPTESAGVLAKDRYQPHASPAWGGAVALDANNERTALVADRHD